MKRLNGRLAKCVSVLCLALAVLMSFASCAMSDMGMKAGKGDYIRAYSKSEGKTDEGDEGSVICGEISGEATSGKTADKEGYEGSVADPTGGSDPELIVPPVQPTAGLLTAAEWSDAEHWDFWMHLINENDWYALAEKWKIFATSRIRVRLGSEETPVAGADVTLMDAEGKTVWQAVSDRRGVADLFWAVDGNKDVAKEGWTIRVKAGETTKEIMWDGSEELDLTDVTGAAGTPKLDLMFTVDTTGSMGDELQYLQAELLNVVARVQTEQQLRARVSVNFYRDEGDEYVVRGFAFTDAARAAQELKAQESGGGGDYPEAVHKALENAIGEHEWDPSGECVKLMFLVLDAPAHNTDQVKESMRRSLVEAAAKGIRVIPVVCSGVDADCEELCRSMAVLTGGTYIFLTDDSGIGGDHLEATVGERKIEPLNDLLVRVIGDYCK